METIMSKDIQKLDCSAVQITGGQQRQAGLIKRISFFFVCFSGRKSKDANANQTNAEDISHHFPYVSLRTGA
jgi:hypothetical protein